MYPALFRALDDLGERPRRSMVSSAASKVLGVSLGDVFSGRSFPRSIRASSIESFRVFRVLSESVTVSVSFYDQQAFI